MKDSREIYDLLNNLDFKIEDYERQELGSSEKKRIKRQVKKQAKKTRYPVPLAIAAALLIVTSLFGQTDLGRIAYGAALSKVEELSYSIGQTLNLRRDVQGYSNVINQVVEENGVGIKLSEVIVDRDELIFTTLIHTEKEADYTDYDYDIWVNGKKIRTGASGSSGRINDSKHDFFHTYMVDVPGIDLEEDLQIRIGLKNFTYKQETDQGMEEEGQAGRWKFEFLANGKTLQASTYSLALDYSFKLGDQVYSLEEFRYNPVSQKIYAEITGSGEEDYMVSLMGQDDLGNPVEFGLSKGDKKSLLFRYENIDGDLSEEARAITLSPYAEKIPEKSGRLPQPSKVAGPAFTIDLK